MKNISVLLASFCAWCAWGVDRSAAGLEGWLDIPFGVHELANPGFVDQTAPEAVAAGVDGPVWRVAANGSNLYGSGDDGGRYVLKGLHGDGEIVARVYLDAATDGLDSTSCAGLMFRTTGRSSARTVAWYRRRVDHTGEGRCWIRGQYRGWGGGTMNWTVPIVNEDLDAAAVVKPWVWLKLVRQGGTVSMLYSASDAPSAASDWVFNNSQAVDFGESAMAGFFATRIRGLNANTYTTNYFANVAVRAFVTAAETDGGLAVSWCATPPVATNDAVSTTYAVARATSRDGTFMSLADGLTDAAYVDAAAPSGVPSFYRVTATRQLADGTSETLLVGTGAGVVRSAAAACALATPAVTGWHYDQWNNDADFLVISNGVHHAPLTVEPNSVSNSVKEHFTMVFNGTLVPETTDDYWFAASSYGSAAIYVNGGLVADTTSVGTWAERDNLTYAGPVRLTAGKPVTLRVVYGITSVTATGLPLLNLQWARSGAPVFSAIPVTNLLPLPRVWTGADFGAPAAYGVSEWDEATGAITVHAGGSSDGLSGHWLARDPAPPSAYETAFAVPAGGVRAGFRVAESLAGDGAFAACFASETGFTLVHRTAAGGPVTTAAADATLAAGAVISLRVTPSETGTAFAYRTAEGDWTDLGSVPFGARLLRVGPAVCAADGAATASVRFLGVTSGAAAMSVLPIADTYIEGYSDAKVRTAQHGGATTLSLQNYGSATGVKQILMKFNTRGLEAVEQAKLRLYLVQHTRETNETIRVTRVMDTAWSEETTCWDSLAASTPLPLAFVATNDAAFAGEFELPKKLGDCGFVEVDVTKAVRASATDGGLLTLGLNIGYGAYATGVNFASRESPLTLAGVDRRPRLVLSGAHALGLTAAAGVGAGEIALRWRFAGSDERYDIYRGAAEGTGEKVATGVPAWQGGWTDTGRADGTVYHYAVVPSGLPSPRLADMPHVAASCVAAARGALAPKADTYIDGQSSVMNKNFWNVDLVLKSSFAVNGTQREGFLLFNVKDLAAAASVKLRLFCATGGPFDTNGWKTYDDVYVQCEALDLGDWSARQTAITWNNSPLGEGVAWPLRTSASVKTWPDQRGVVRVKMCGWSGTFQYIDVTDMVRSFAQAGGEWLTFNLYRTDTYGNNNCQYGNLEQGNSARRPALLYALAETAVEPEFASETAPTPHGRVVAHDDTFIDGALTATGAINYRNQHFNLKCYNGPTREDLFRFDVAGLDNVASARLRFCVYPTDSIFQEGGILACDISDTAADWDVTVMNWNNAPWGINKNYKNTLVPDPTELGRIPMCPWSRAQNADQYFFEFDATENVRRAARAGHDLAIKLCGDSLHQGVQGKAYFTVCSTKIAADDADVRKPALYYTIPDAAHSAVAFTSVASNRTATVSWHPVPGAASYTLLRTSSKGGETKTVAENVTDLSVAEEELRTDGTTYGYALVVNYADGTSETGAVKTVEASRESVFQRDVADTFVFYGAPDQVQGTNLSMMVKYDPNLNPGGYQRESFIRFDISDLPEDWCKAEIELQLASINSDTGYNVVAESVEDTGWTENGDGALTWTTSGLPGATAIQPERTGFIYGGRTPVASMTNNCPTRITLTAPLRAAQKAGQSTMVVHLYSDTAGAQKNLAFHTRETSSRSFRPRLVLSYDKYPQASTMLILR